MSKNTITELTTYAQNREDLYLYALLSDVKKGFYVDVGANHEELHSVTKLFYELGWSGINIEPNKKLIAEFKEKRGRDKNIQVGASNVEGKLSFREYPDYDGLSTLSDKIKELHEDNDIPYIDYDIPVQKLSTLFKEQKVKKIDFMKIDVEGHELAVLEGNDWKKYRPTVTTFEGTDKERCIAYLEKQGYKLEFFDGLNYYMIDAKNSDTTIHKFAGTVLSKGLYTAREKQLEREIHGYEEQARSAVAGRDDLMAAINRGLGIKTSLRSLIRSILLRIANKH